MTKTTIEQVERMPAGTRWYAPNVDHRVAVQNMDGTARWEDGTGQVSWAIKPGTDVFVLRASEYPANE